MAQWIESLMPHRMKNTVTQRWAVSSSLSRRKEWITVLLLCAMAAARSTSRLRRPMSADFTRVSHGERARQFYDDDRSPVCRETRGAAVCHFGEFDGKYK